MSGDVLTAVMSLLSNQSHSLISSTLITPLTQAQVALGLSVTSNSTGTSYKSLQSTVAVQGAVQLDQLGTVFLDKVTVKGQWMKLAGVLQQLFTAVNTAVKNLTINVLYQEQVAIVLERVSAACLHYEVLVNGQFSNIINFVAPSFTNVSTAVATQLNLTALDLTLKAQNVNGPMTQDVVRFSELVRGTLALALEVGETDIEAFNEQMTVALAPMLEAMGLPQPYLVKLAFQQEVVSDLDVGSSYFDQCLAMYSNGEVVDARMLGTVNVSTLLSALSSLPLTGFNGSFADVVVPYSQLGPVIPTSTLLAIPLQGFLPRSGFTVLAGVLTTTLAAALGVPASKLTVQVARVEEVQVNGTSLVQVSLSILNNGTLVDVRTDSKIQNISITAISTAIAKNATLQQLGVKVANVSSKATVVPIGETSRVCFNGVLRQTDVNTALQQLDKEYTYKIFKTDAAVSASGALLTCVYYTVNSGTGQLVISRPSVPDLQAKLATITTSLGGQFKLVVEGKSTQLTSVDQMFKVYLTAGLTRNQTAILTQALAKTWSTIHQGVNVSISSPVIREVVIQGQVMFEVVYSVSVNGVSLDSRIDSSITLQDLQVQLQAIGLQQNLLYLGSTGGLLVKSSLCQLPTYQRLSIEVQQNVTQTALQTAIGLGGVSVQLIFQEEGLTKAKRSVYIMYYALWEQSGSKVECPLYNSQLTTKLSAQLSSVITLSGSTVQLVAPADLVTVYSKSKAFTLHLKTALASTDEAALIQGLTGVWGGILGGVLSVEIRGQEELLTVQGTFVWSVYYYVMVQGTVVDARFQADLTGSQLNTVFTGIKNSITSLSYDVFNATISLFDYQQKFVVYFDDEILLTDYLSELSVLLKTVWTNSNLPGLNASVIGTWNFTIVTFEEVVDSNGVTAFQLLYFVSTTGGAVVDGRDYPSIASTQFNTAIEDMDLTGPKGDLLKVSLTFNTTTTYRVNRNFLAKLTGLLSDLDVTVFVKAVQSAWGSTSQVVIIRNELYVYQSKLVSGILYSVSVAGQVLTPQTSVAVNTSVLITALSKQQFTSPITVLPQGALTYRYRFGFNISLRIPVKMSVYTTLQTNLLIHWQATLTDFTNINITVLLQEEMVTETGDTFWQLLYFTQGSSQGGNSTVLKPSYFPDITTADLQTILYITVPDQPALMYSDFLFSEFSSQTIVRVSDLFSFYTTVPVTSIKFTDIEAKLVSVWQQTNAALKGVNVTILYQQEHVTRVETTLWKVFYKMELQNITLLMRNYKLPDVNTLKSALVVALPSGNGSYTLVDGVVLGALALDTAFTVYTQQAVRKVNRTVILNSLQAQFGLGVNLSFAITQELLQISGGSVFTFSFFANSSTGLLDAQFYNSLSTANLSVVFSLLNITLFTGELSDLVSYNDLQTAVLSGSVLTTDYNQIEQGLTAQWSQLTALPSITVHIVQQEEYLATTAAEGVVVYALLYTVRTAGRLLAPTQVPVLAQPLVHAVLQGVSARYQVVGAGLQGARRLAQAVVVAVSRWISQSERGAVLRQLQALYNGTTTQYGVQETYCRVDTQATSIRFSFYLLAGGGGSLQVVDGRLEKAVDTGTLTTRLVQAGVKGVNVTQVDWAGVNLRYAFTLYFNGPVAPVDISSILTQAVTTWQSTVSTALLKKALQQEYVGQRGVTVHGISYFLFNSVTSTLVQSGTVLSPNLTLSVVSSVTGKAYVQYTEAVMSYDSLFPLYALGEVANDTAQAVLTEVQTVWSKTRPGAQLTMVKLELLFGTAGTQVTRILYSVNVSGFMTFPANDPTPTLDEVNSGLSGSPVDAFLLYTGDVTQFYRLEDHFSLTLGGDLTTRDVSTKRISITNSLQTAWGGLSSTSFSSLVLAGRVVRYLSSTSSAVNRLYYRIIANNSITKPFEVAAPSLTVDKSQGLSIVTGTTLQVASVLMNAQLSTSQISSFTSSLKTVWQSAQGTSVAVKISVLDNKDQYKSSQQSLVYKIQYAVSINGLSPEELSPPAYTPTQHALTTAVASLNPCGCTARRRYTLLIKGSTTDVQSKLNSIGQAIGTAWNNNNPGLNGGLKVTVSLPGVRRNKRQADTSTGLQTSDGATLTPVDYNLDANGADPDLFFINATSPDELGSAISNDTGLSVCTSNCQVSVCNNTILLQGSLTTADLPSIQVAVTKAYAAANSLNSSVLTVTATIVNNALQDSVTRNPLTNVSYCVSRNDGQPASDLTPPSDTDLGTALLDQGLTKAPPNTKATTTPHKTEVRWLIILLAVLGSIAVILVVAAIVRLVYKQRLARQTRDEEALERAYNQSQIRENDYQIGRGAYKTFGSGKSLGSRVGSRPSTLLSSKVQFYDDRGMIYTS